MDNSAAKQFDKMTKTPIKKLISRLAIPTVISMLITMLYNIADTYFVSKISVAASGACGVLLSLMGLIQAFGFMFGQGAGSNISRKLGAKEIEQAREYSSTAYFLGLSVGLIIMAAGLIFLEPAMLLMGSTKTILPLAKTYGTYILIAAPAMTTSFVMNNILRFEGMAKFAMIGIATGGILNIILDPLLIFSLDMGIAGAGLATAASQYIGMFILLIFFLLKKPQSRISFRYLSFKPRITLDIITVGLPSFARQGLNSVSTMLFNQQAAVFGDECIAAISIVAKIGMFIFSVALGIGQGFQPVCSFNFGAKLYDRVREAVKFLWIYASAVIAVMSGICFILAPRVIELFRKDEGVVEIGTTALRLLCIAIISLPTVMVGNMAFQSVGKSGRAFFLACAQNGLFFIPLVLILPKLFGILGIQLAWPISYLIAAIIAVPMIIQFLNELKKQPTV
ncbi:MAG: MATE family efflux transporter [Eubacterium sp.]|nr:MATE family efflux transporter [Eubacterium sp.]MBR4242039.1 MATE family efflux transporter [Eubacterium sp.]MBR7060496.1 MATE family efflux transporter [Eubacterium sp.]